MKTSRWSATGVVVAAFWLGASVAHAQGDELLVTNVQAQPRPDTGLVDVTYDLETVGDVAVTVRLFLSSTAVPSYSYLCRTVTGDVGAGVRPGTSRHIVWDAGADVPDLSSATCRLRVTADDAPNLDDFVYVAPGAFTMGSPTNEPGRLSNEAPHQVTLTQGVDVQATEVTNQQYTEMAQWAYDHGHATVAGNGLYDNLDGSAQLLKLLGPGDYEISFSNGVFSCTNPDHPVQYVTWYGSAAYCDWLSLQQDLTRAYDHGTWQCNGAAGGYRLPTEAEWEYACRAGSATAFANGPITWLFCSPLDPNLDQLGWYCGNAGGWTQPVAQKQPNAWGLFDMHGNLNEWCNDWFAAYGGAATNPVGPQSGTVRVIRGGLWLNDAQYCRSAYRGVSPPALPNFLIGLRPVRSTD